MNIQFMLKDIENNNNELNNIESKTHNTNYNDFYESILNNKYITEIGFSGQDIDYLFSSIDRDKHEKIDRFGLESLLILLVDFDKDELNPMLVRSQVDYFWFNHKSDYYKEAIAQDKEAIAQDKEAIAQDKEAIAQDKEAIANTINRLNKFYDESLDEAHKPNPEQISEFTNQFSNPQLLETLAVANIGPEDYFKIRFSAESIIKSKDTNNLDSSDIGFINQFNSLNRSLDIDYQIQVPTQALRLSSKPSNVADLISSPESAFSYPSVAEYSNSLPDSFDDKTNFEFKSNMLSDIISKLPKEMLGDMFGQIRDNCVKQGFIDVLDFVSNADRADINYLINQDKLDGMNNETKANIQGIIETISSGYANEYIKTRTNEFIKQTAVKHAIAGLSRYFENTNPKLENFAQDFKLEGDESVKIENGILKLSGTMHGQVVNFFYNLETGELQSNDYLHKAMAGEGLRFEINNPDRKITLPNKLPTIGNLVGQINDINIKSIAESESSLDKYRGKLTNRTKPIADIYDRERINRFYVERKVERNLMIQSTMDMVSNKLGLKMNLSLDNSERPVRITNDLNPNEYRLMEILHKTSLYHRDPASLRRFRNMMGQIDRILSDKDKPNDPIFESFFGSDAMTQSKENWQSLDKKSNFTVFFEAISYNSSSWRSGTIDMTLFEKIVNAWGKKESVEGIVDLPTEISGKIADDELEKELAEI